MISACPSYAGYRFSAKIISHAVWLCFHFPLSLRMVDDLPGVWHRKATTTASSTDSTLECDCLDPVGWSVTEVRCFHLAMVFVLMPYRLASTLGLS